MFGSQALETAIGLAVLFFVVSTAASMITETIAQVFTKRARDLNRAIGALLKGSDAEKSALRDAIETFQGTAAYDAAKAGAGKRLGLIRRDPSYLSAKAFADGALEVITKDGKLTVLDTWPAGLKKMLTPIVREAGADLAAIKARLEGTFDEAMKRAEGAYKRWTTVVLFVIGLLIAVSGNVSTIDVARNLWHDSVTRQAVVDAAGQVAAEGPAATEIQSVADATDNLEQLQLPVGWTQEAKNEWSDGFGLAEVATIAGWLLTALLVMMGAPFWFDTLTRLVTLRSSGAKPPVAADDPLSATATIEARQTHPSPAPDSGLTQRQSQPTRPDRRRPGRSLVSRRAPEDQGQPAQGEPDNSVYSLLAKALRVDKAPSAPRSERSRRSR